MWTSREELLVKLTMLVKLFRTHNLANIEEVHFRIYIHSLTSELPKIRNIERFTDKID